MVKSTTQETAGIVKDVEKGMGKQATVATVEHSAELPQKVKLELP